mmetsp:Transcript_89554/g.225226  ORF Transcript_89554/g.225226 Transcript_89554/m.225226 type:complete len:245 (+) Transcript_89554:62-796(+)
MGMSVMPPTPMDYRTNHGRPLRTRSHPLTQKVQLHRTSQAGVPVAGSRAQHRKLAFCKRQSTTLFTIIAATVAGACCLLPAACCHAQKLWHDRSYRKSAAGRALLTPSRQRGYCSLAQHDSQAWPHPFRLRSRSQQTPMCRPPCNKLGPLLLLVLARPRGSYRLSPAGTATRRSELQQRGRNTNRRFRPQKATRRAAAETAPPRRTLSCTPSMPSLRPWLGWAAAVPPRSRRASSRPNSRPKIR